MQQTHTHEKKKTSILSSDSTIFSYLRITCMSSEFKADLWRLKTLLGWDFYVLTIVYSPQENMDGRQRSIVTNRNKES